MSFSSLLCLFVRGVLLALTASSGSFPCLTAIWARLLPHIHSFLAYARHRCVTSTSPMMTTTVSQFSWSNKEVAKHCFNCSKCQEWNNPVLRRLKEQTNLEWLRKASLVKCDYWCDLKYFYGTFPWFSLWGLLPLSSAISRASFTEVASSVSITPRLTHPALHLHSELEKLAFFVVLSYSRNKRALSPAMLNMGTRVTTVLYYKVKIRSPPCVAIPTTQANLAIGREIWHQGPCDQFYLENFSDPVSSHSNIFFSHFTFYFWISSLAFIPCELYIKVL